MSKQYDNYLIEHIGAVQKAADWMTKFLNRLNSLPPMVKTMFMDTVSQHDLSKYSPDEYDAYDAYFCSEGDQVAFNDAWLHHIHNNPHHWQHWVLINDDGNLGDGGKVIALEMPEVYALEMVADWWSFSWRSGNLSEVFGWYEEHKDGIILHPNTREYVEAVLGEIREKLQTSDEAGE